MTTPTAKRTHLLYLTVSAEERREIRFADHADGVEVYTFDGLDCGAETTRVMDRAEARTIWTAAVAEGYVWTRSIVDMPPAPAVSARVETPAPAAVEPAPAPAPKPRFESEICSRCHGTGKFSRCQMYGDTCFKCGGAGRTYTKRGLAARAHLTALRSKRVADIQPGDVVYHRGGGPFPASWETTGEGWAAERIACGWKPESMVRVRQTREQSIATWDAALAYQDTLTKAGTPRVAAKRRESVAA